MAGTKGRSGGPRQGAGRKAKEPAASGIVDPLIFLQKVWAGEIDANANQVRAAASALPFVHPKKAGAGKKEPVPAPTTPSKYAVRTGPRLVSSA